MAPYMNASLLPGSRSSSLHRRRRCPCQAHGRSTPHLRSWYYRRLEVTPGLTGLWQVLGRSDTSFDEMVRLDIYYAENWTPGLDMRIILQTLPVVFSGAGAY